MLKKLMSRIINRNRLENATPEYRDNEYFVAKCIAKHGAEQFALASKRLKSNAQFVLDMVNFCPECLRECDDVLFDRYEEDGKIIEIPVDKMLFSAMCCANNVDAFMYLKPDIAKEYLEAVQKKQIIMGSFQGKECLIQLPTDEEYIDLLNYIRYGYSGAKRF